MKPAAPQAPAHAEAKAHADPTLFTDSLVIGVDLATTLGPISVPGGNVKHLSLALEPYGFQGEVVFWMPAAEDGGVHAQITDEALLEVTISVAKLHYLEETPPSPLALKGVATARSFIEVTSMDVVGSPVLFRQYTLVLDDAARALWSQHHPTDVYAKTTLETVLKGHTPGAISLSQSWPALKSKRPLVCLALGEDEASFYDFLCWFADENQGHLTYDYSAKSFRLADQKPAALLTTAVAADVCGEARVHLCEPLRFAINVLNSHAQGTARTAVANDLAVATLEHDVLLHTPLAQETKDRESLEKRRLRAGKPELELRCKAFPEVYLAPGVAAKLDDGWSSHLHLAGKTLRTIGVRLEAKALDDAPEKDVGLESTDYQIRLTYRFEQESDPRPRLPAYRRPRYPLMAEGKIQSTLGDDGDRAFMVYEDESTSRDYYKVLLSVWNATIDVPFQPGFQPGHLYFPAYKDARVMLRLGFDSARIETFLDWGSNVRVPTTSQGNHILFGKNSTSETSMRNWYVDAKPEFQIKRVHSGDNGVVTVKHGVITIETFNDNPAAAMLGVTVSLKAEAEGSKASAEAETDLATSDLESAVESLGTGLGGQVEESAAVVKDSVTSLESDVRARGETASSTLASVGADAEAAVDRAKQVAADARNKVRSLFEGE